MYVGCFSTFVHYQHYRLGYTYLAKRDRDVIVVESGDHHRRYGQYVIAGHGYLKKKPEERNALNNRTAP